ncbi:hypothetical protein, partial [Mycobacterium avium]
MAATEPVAATEGTMPAERAVTPAEGTMPAERAVTPAEGTVAPTERAVAAEGAVTGRGWAGERHARRRNEHRRRKDGNGDG